MKNWIDCHMESIKIITVEYWWRLYWNVKVFEDESHQCHLRYGVGHKAVLSFSVGARDCMLLFYTIRNKIVSKENTESNSGMSSSVTSFPIYI
jgi:hypothetical protein